MNLSHARSILGVLATLALFVATGIAAAEELRQSATAGDIRIYYGFLPAEVAARSTAAHDDKPMHGRPRRGDYHLMVALYDKTGERITDAEVQASVGEIGLTPTRKRLESMTVGDTVTFGNYFPMRNAGQYTVALEIRLPGAARSVEARFDHQHR